MHFDLITFGCILFFRKGLVDPTNLTQLLLHFATPLQDLVPSNWVFTAVLSVDLSDRTVSHLFEQLDLLLGLLVQLIDYLFDGCLADGAVEVFASLALV